MPFSKHIEEHANHFSGEARPFSAPARVNLIGEHTDYTGGFVLPMAIGFRTIAIISRRDDKKAVLRSLNFGEEVEFELSADVRPTGKWSDYPMGVLWSLREKGVEVPPFSLTVHGDVPLGSGLSSSASIEVATAMAMLHLAKRTLPGEEIALLCQRAENAYVGANCGIMDQFVITNAVAHRALLLDCRSLKYELLPLPESVRVVVVNSMVQHSVASGEYGGRRQDVERGQAVLHRRNSSIELLRDASLEDLEAARADMDDAAYRRCRHILSENGRVMAVKGALAKGNMPEVGRILNEAHESVREDFEASCPEVDVLVDLAQKLPGCYGARITGGGFGGCTVNLVEEAHAETFAKEIARGYQAAVGIEPQVYICEAVDGAMARIEKEQRA